VRVNPLELSMEMPDFALTEADGAPIAAFKRCTSISSSPAVPPRLDLRRPALEGFDLRADIAPMAASTSPSCSPACRSANRTRSEPPRVLLQTRRRLVAAPFPSATVRSPSRTARRWTPIDLEVHGTLDDPDAPGQYTVSVRLPRAAASSGRAIARWSRSPRAG
jgi:hypothetical protein